MSFMRKLLRRDPHAGVRRHRWSLEALMLRPPAPILWVPDTEGGCDRCRDAYPLDQQRHVHEQTVGQRQAGPRCFTCGHVIKREELVEYHDRKNEVALLLSCHGDEELHVLDLGSVEWHHNATNPGDTLEMVRSMRMALPAFVPSEQGEKTVVAGA